MPSQYSYVLGPDDDWQSMMRFLPRAKYVNRGGRGFFNRSDCLGSSFSCSWSDVRVHESRKGTAVLHLWFVLERRYYFVRGERARERGEGTCV